MTSSMLIHPGEMIKDEIIARGLTQKELARQMGVSYTVFFLRFHLCGGVSTMPNPFVYVKLLYPYVGKKRDCYIPEWLNKHYLTHAHCRHLQYLTILGTCKQGHRLHMSQEA